MYKGCTVDNTTLHALNEISISATGVTIGTMKDLEHFLDYCATHPEVEIVYWASDMQLFVDINVAYLVAPKARSRIAGYLYLGNKGGKLFNGPIYVVAKVIKSVMASEAEAECGGLYINAQEAVPLIIILEELGHKQDVVPLKTDNSTEEGIMNKTIKQKRSKVMEMRFYWLVDRVSQKIFKVYWAPGSINLAAYFSKKLPASHHRTVQPIYTYIK